MIKKLGRKILGPLFSPDSFLHRTYHLSRGIAASTINQFPTRRMIVIGVTGTNGKTTVSNLIAEVIKGAGHKVGLSTTVNFWVGNKEFVNKTKMTTDSPFVLNRRLKEMEAAGTEYVILETASHALSQNRTWGINYDVAVFTNLSWDHLDYHKSFEDYRDTKVKLFEQTFLSKTKNALPKMAIINLNDENSSHFINAFPGTKYYFGVEQFDTNTIKESSITTKIIQMTKTGSKFELQTPSGNATINLPLPGKFNIENALAAASTCFALGFTIEQIKTGLESAKRVPGRIEYIDHNQNFDVVVDYAHNPDGFEKSLSALRHTTKNKLIAVFGAAGDRDKGKRPELGKIASQYADIIILTEEDPGSEDPQKIIEAIKPGLSDKFKDKTNLFEIIDRKQAITKAIELAKPGDTVVALAMGAQTVMATKTGNIDYNEREFITKLLQSSTK
ncbi:MAG: UDP-N-acetylmuramoyl-L-alanyl-D-glutamate--2,6-diaminopimelate ligase [Patescibacteria group bacterium]